MDIPPPVFEIPTGRYGRPKLISRRMGLAAEDEDANGGSGNWALLGYDYQVDVSVWLALDLMVASRLAIEMTLEHVSEEDVEADVEEFEPGPVTDDVRMRAGYRLIVQAKRRTGNAWTEARYLSLLRHGVRRTSALRRLADDPTARYLLVTSAALNDPVRALGVRSAGSWPPAQRVPEGIAAAGAGIAGRLAVVGGQDDERLVRDMKELLLERFQVPRSRWEEALDVLRRAAWARMRGEAGGVWTREEVERVVVAHEGYMVAGAERDDYVRPTNWGDLSAALDTRNAIIIVGQSGSGKTATAGALWRDRKAAIPDLRHVHITHGPEQLQDDRTLPPVFYEIEDPWGRFRFEPDSRPWNDRLADALLGARHDRIVVATSRADVAEASGALDTVERWRMPLDAQNYGLRERQALYRNLSRDLAPEILAVAHEHEAAVLRQLELPLEIRKFFDALPGLDRTELDRNAAAAIASAVERAHRDAIERTVAEQIEARAAVRPAAILWALIKPHGRLSAEVLRSLEDSIVDADPTLEDAIGSLVNGLLAARNLRQSADGSLGYYHGKVEAGIETALAAHPQAVRRTLANLVNVLLARDDDAGTDWGVATAADIMRLSRRIPNATPTLVRASQDRIDRLVEGRLDAAGRELGQATAFAAEVGSARSGPSEFARWLGHRPDPGFPGLTHWGRPQRDEAWHQRMRADPAVAMLAARFVRTVLPTDNTDYEDRFAADLAEVAGDLGGAFVDAALASAHYGYIANDDAIAAGALADLDVFEPVVDAAVEALTPTPADLERAERDHLLIYNEEVSEDYAEHLSTNDDGMTAQTYLDAFVERLRSERGHAAITGHRHFVRLRRIWLRLIGKPDGEVGPDEIDTAVATAWRTEDERELWSLLTARWADRHGDLLAKRVTEGSTNVGIRLAALDCLVEHIPDAMQGVADRLAAAGDPQRLAELASDLGHRSARRGHDGRDRSERAAALVDTLPHVWRELARAEAAIVEGKTAALSGEAQAALAAIPDPPEDVRATRLALATQLGIDAGDDVRWMLANTEDHDHALAAIDLAALRGMEPELHMALHHRYAKVAARALTARASPLAAPLPPEVLALSKRSSSPVRLALLAQLAAKPHPDHLATLVALTTDEWQRWSPHHADDDAFPVARSAVDAITALDFVPVEVLAGFVATAQTTGDLGLMSRMLSCAVRHGGQELQTEVVAISRTGPKVAVARAAAEAIFAEEKHVPDAVIGAITVRMAMRLPAPIAGSHVATLGLRAPRERVDTLAAALAESEDRRVFLAILAIARCEVDPGEGASVAALLPAGHPARRRAIGEEIAISREMLIDLGDASAVKEALDWLGPDAA